MEKINLKKIFSVGFILLLIAAMAIMGTACGKTGQSDTASVVSTAQKTEVGTGKTVFEFTVDDGETVKEYTVKTDKKTVGEALAENNLITVENTMVTAVNGKKLDYQKDGKYWAFYINGTYASTGVEDTEIKAGESYALKAEKA